MEIELLVDYLKKFPPIDLEKSEFDKLRQKIDSLPPYQERLDFWLDKTELSKYVGEVIGMDWYCFREVEYITDSNGKTNGKIKPEIYGYDHTIGELDNGQEYIKYSRRKITLTPEIYESKFISVLPQSPKQTWVFNEVRSTRLSDQVENDAVNPLCECLNSEFKIQRFKEKTELMAPVELEKYRQEEIEAIQNKIEKYSNPKVAFGLNPWSLTERLFKKMRSSIAGSDLQEQTDIFHLRTHSII